MAFGLTSRKPSKLIRRELKTDLAPLEIFSRLSSVYDRAFILESVEGPERLAEYSFIGFDPIATIRAKDGTIEIISEQEKVRRKTNDPLTEIRGIVTDHSYGSDASRFIGGAVGYVSYDSIRYWENLSNGPKDDLRFPDIEMGIFADGIVFDHKRQRQFYYSVLQDRFPEVQQGLATSPILGPLEHSEPFSNISREDFMAKVANAKEYIAAGDIFQVVLSRRYRLRYTGDLLRFYRQLRRINPSPYMYYLKMASRQIIGSSPEMLVRVEGRRVETYPIAGTRPRGSDPQDDLRKMKELEADPKERAEHVMLVDLARNDVGRVSKHGTVRVPELMFVQKYSHVQHIVSRVVGELRRDQDSYGAFRALFPAGTVTGAPKVRAMEIIDESEQCRRGPYAGAVGYFSFNGNADFAISIRTLFAEGSDAYIQAGAGIVADSMPEHEWMETEQKAQALLRAFEMAREAS